MMLVPSDTHKLAPASLTVRFSDDILPLYLVLFQQFNVPSSCTRAGTLLPIVPLELELAIPNEIRLLYCKHAASKSGRAYNNIAQRV